MHINGSHLLNEEMIQTIHKQKQNKIAVKKKREERKQQQLTLIFDTKTTITTIKVRVQNKKLHQPQK